MLALLLESNADVTLSDANGTTPLIAAEMEGWGRCQELLRRGTHATTIAP
jgi:ankyrin repeat protein